MTMITLAQDQPMFTDNEWCVLAGGDYADTDLVPVYRVRFPEQIVAYHAQYVATGMLP